jgi:hypothetical protein
MAQMVRRLDENPKDFPKNRSRNIMAEMTIPETHQDHGWLINSIMNEKV